MKKEIVKFQEVENLIIQLRGQRVLLDKDVATLYGVETRDINKSVRNNPDKFPIGYCFNLQFAEKQYVVENFHRFQSLKFSTMEPRAFTEKGLYMLATILKSERATQTTIAIVETFAKLKELSRTVSALSEANGQKQKSLTQKSGELIADLLDDEQKVTDSETTIELNLAVLKVKHTVKRKTEKEDTKKKKM